MRYRERGPPEKSGITQLERTQTKRTEETVTNWRDERRGAEAIVREGEAAFPHIREQIEKHGPIHCWVGKGLDGVRCEHTAVMEVYGTPMCEDHGAEAKAGALEELYDDASQEISRPFNLHVR
jgi:hypothetical protein